MLRIHVVMLAIGIILYFAAVHFSVDITIDGLADSYTIGDTIDFTAHVSGIGTTTYSHYVEFENTKGKLGGIGGMRHSGPGPTYLNPPLYFSEDIKIQRELEPGKADAGEYTMRFGTLGHTIEKKVTVLPAP